MVRTVGRRGAVITASGAVLCVVAFALLLWFAATAPDGGGGYVASGAAGPSHDPDRLVPPEAGVTLVPLPPTSSSTAVTSRGPAPATAASPPGPSGSAPAPSHTPPAITSPSPTPATPSSPVPQRPAHLSVSTPQRSATDQRWCENVTVTFVNTGDMAATSGTVTFATHIIGLLGIDWATIDTTENVPAPIAGGARRTQTYGICVDAWRVPLGMHIETRGVTLS